MYKVTNTRTRKGVYIDSEWNAHNLLEKCAKLGAGAEVIVEHVRTHHRIRCGVDPRNNLYISIGKTFEHPGALELYGSADFVPGEQCCEELCGAQCPCWDTCSARDIRELALPQLGARYADYTISESTLRDDVLKRAYREFIHMVYGYEAARAFAACTDAEDVMHKIAPPGTYFGAHPGDGACIGFWRCADE